MILRPPKSLEKETSKAGAIALIYSETGVGKTASALQSLPGIVLMLVAEARDVERSAEAVGRKPTDYIILEYTDFLDWMEFINNPIPTLDKFVELYPQYKCKTGEELWGKINSIVLDGLTQLCANIRYETEGQTFDAKTSDAKLDKPLIAMTKLEYDGWGAVASHLSRMMKSVCSYSQEGKFIVINALQTENPKWDRSLQAAPSLIGKQFPDELPGKCDLIGMAVSRYNVDKLQNEDGTTYYTKEIVFPPLVKFECGISELGMQETFQAKWTGLRPKRKSTNKTIMDAIVMPLDYRIIFGLTKEKEEK